ncbi:hypothetical protein [Natrinema versiforme]|uniref:DUF7974 domain-containing protein n=1 Tax=Natrinema versiforme JCM 10478 TaxID=1227496 RepID=L9YAE2_9EURY|nr:hypothetical protein [Natrinema versiforme]ELY71024.1 hypothetical protein C489_01671 [Natrinema versiforme JCM 10478]
MRRIYESRALERADDDPFTPEGDNGEEPGPRTIDWAAFSHAFTPLAIRHRGISVDVSTDKRRYERGESVEITVEFRNRFPFPIRIRTESPNRWYWTVDGLRNASRVPQAVPDRPAAFSFARGERKRFRREWPQRIQVTDEEWESVDPGTYTIGAGISRSDADDRGLVDRVEIEIVR